MLQETDDPAVEHTLGDKRLREDNEGAVGARRRGGRTVRHGKTRSHFTPAI